MQSRAVILGIAFGAMLGSLGLALADPVTLNVASTFPGQMPVLGDVSRGLPIKVERASGGDLILKFHEPGKPGPGILFSKAVPASELGALLEKYHAKQAAA